MRKYVSIICMILMATFILSGCGENGTNSEKVREATIYDKDADTFVTKLKAIAIAYNFDISEPQYSDTDSNGQKYCNLYFGGDTNNKITIKLNEDNSIVYVDILIPNEFEAGQKAGAMAGGTLVAIGMNQDEYSKVWDAYVKYAVDEISKQNNSTSPIIDNSFVGHCSATNKDIKMSVKGDAYKNQFLIGVAK